MRTVLIIILFLSGLSIINAQRQNDVSGAKDHALISRYPGSDIVYYNTENFNTYSIATGPVTGYKKIDAWVTVEGRLTRIYYELKGNTSITEVYRNYLSAMEKAGFNIMAKGLEPKRNNSQAVGGTSWMNTFYLKNPYPTNSNILMGAGSSSIGGSAYIAGKVQKGGGTAYVVFAGKEYSSDKKIYMIDIIEAAAMADDLITVNADEMLKGIRATGKYIIYGILFDFDKADIKPESAATINEIASLMKKDPNLNIYVVGHTDMKGRFDYNLDLSKRRAAAVANELISKHGISSARLTPDGVGPLAPVTTNVTEEGRKENRRVELVLRIN